jgi:hypothetical protein
MRWDGLSRIAKNLGGMLRKTQNTRSNAMVTPSQIQSLSQLPNPVVTVYLNTYSAKPSRHLRVPRALSWLKKHAESLASQLRGAESSPFQEELSRVEAFLNGRHPHEKSLVIFAGPGIWMILPMEIAVENELTWGPPAVGQLFRLIREHKSCCIVAVDHRAARFFSYSLGELTQLATKEFDVDPSQWKRKSLGHLTSGRIRNMRGPFPDRFEHRIEVQYTRLCRETAEQAAALSKQHSLAHIFIAGPDRLIQAMQKHFPPAFGERVCLVPEDLGKFPATQLLRRLEPIIAEFEQKRQMAAVTQLLSDGQGAVTDRDETLARLQNGSIRAVLVSHGLDFDLRQCVKCGLASSAADPVCSACEGELRKVALSELLPVLLTAQDAEVEFVSGEAARALERSGGMGGWLRRAKATTAR